MFKMNMKKTIASILAATMAVSMLSVNVSAAMSVKRHVWTDKYGKEHTHYCDYKDSEFCTLQKTVDLKDEYGYSYIERPTSTTNSNSNSISSKYSSSDKVDRIVKMKYYGKAITSAPITSDAKLCSSIQYAAAQGATKITLKYADSYTDAEKKAWQEYHSDVWGNATLTLSSGTARASGASFKDRQLALFVYAYRYGHSDLIKKEDKETQELYNKCVKILKECGVNDKKKSDMEKISAILNWLNTNVEYGKPSDGRGEWTNRKYYSTLVLGYAGGGCGSYSDAFQLLTRMAGYKSWCVDGKTDPSKSWWSGSSNHVWNAIRINGELRFVEPQKTDWIMTYDELSDYGYIPDMTEKKLEMYCQY